VRRAGERGGARGPKKRERSQQQPSRGVKVSDVFRPLEKKDAERGGRWGE